MKRPRWIVSLLAAMAFVISACAGDDDEGNGDAEGADAEDAGAEEQVTLQYWGFEGLTGEFLDTVKAEFESANPNITVEITTFPEEQFPVRMQTALAADQPPDLALVFGNESNWMRDGVFLPLDDMIAEKGIDLSTFGQGIISEGDDFSCVFEGTLYCLGSFQGSGLMIYNKDLFDAASIPYPEPWPAMTPDEFFDIACELTDPANEVWGAGVSDPLVFLPLEVLVSEDGRTADGVNSEISVQVFENLARLFSEECVPSLDIVDPWTQGRDFFARGQLGIVLTDYLELTKVEEAGINYGTTVPPAPEGHEPWFFNFTNSTGVLADTDHPEEALELIAFLATEGQRIRFETTGDLPLDLAVAEEVDWAAGIPGRLDGLEALEHARAQVFIPNKWDVIAPFFDAWGLVVGGEQDAQSALDEAAPLIQENLDNAWRVWEEGGSSDE